MSPSTGASSSPKQKLEDVGAKLKKLFISESKSKSISKPKLKFLSKIKKSDKAKPLPLYLTQPKLKFEFETTCATYLDPDKIPRHSKPLIKEYYFIISAGNARPVELLQRLFAKHGMSAEPFCDDFNQQTSTLEFGSNVPVFIYIYDDKTFSFCINHRIPPRSLGVRPLPFDSWFNM